MTDKKELEAKLRRYEKQEQLLQFPHFSNADALDLGLKLIAEAKKRGIFPAFDITVSGFKVFRYGFEGTNQHNDAWLNRKINTVNAVHKSSLHVGVLLEYKGKTAAEEGFLPVDDFVFVGGGFPICIKGTGVIGSVCCSGLYHETDHQLLVDVLCDYLNVDPAELEA
jgi:uncharacterized protein (UPF0303 family)